MRRITWLYEGTMALLAVAVIWLLTPLPDAGWVRVANLVIWAIFVVDYGVRLAQASDRRRFVRQNIPDLMAITPLDYLRAFRLARLVRAVRAATVLWRVSKNVRGNCGHEWLWVCSACYLFSGCDGRHRYLGAGARH